MPVGNGEQAARRVLSCFMYHNKIIRFTNVLDALAYISDAYLLNRPQPSACTDAGACKEE